MPLSDISGSNLQFAAKPYISGEGGIRTLGPPLGSHGFSKPAHSTTLPPLQFIISATFLDGFKVCDTIEIEISTPDCTPDTEELKERLISKSTTKRQPNKAGATEKPHPDFPLFPHARGYLAKKVRGKHHCFDNVSTGPQGAAALQTGRDIFTLRRCISGTRSRSLSQTLECLLVDIETPF